VQIKMKQLLGRSTMKFVRFRKDDCCSYGLLEGDLVKKIEGDIFGTLRLPNAATI